MRMLIQFESLNSNHDLLSRLCIPFASMAVVVDRRISSVRSVHVQSAPRQRHANASEAGRDVPTNIGRPGTPDGQGNTRKAFRSSTAVKFRTCGKDHHCSLPGEVLSLMSAARAAG